MLMVMLYKKISKPLYSGFEGLRMFSSMTVHWQRLFTSTSPFDEKCSVSVVFSGIKGVDLCSNELKAHSKSGCFFALNIAYYAKKYSITLIVQ